jgi:hypothetical protein
MTTALGNPANTERGKEREWGWEYNVNLVREHCTRVWNSHNETPSCYSCMMNKKLNKTIF